MQEEYLEIKDIIIRAFIILNGSPP